MLRGLVDDVRTAFERENDTAVYIPTLYPTIALTIS